MPLALSKKRAPSYDKITSVKLNLRMILLAKGLYASIMPNTSWRIRWKSPDGNEQSGDQ